MSQAVRVGMIGTSWWADGRLLPNLKSHPRADVVALCGRDRARAQALAGKYDIPHVFVDYRDMIERAGLDAVVIAAPDDLHYPMTMAALEAGLHVVCEKPLASNALQAAEMYEKAEAAGVKHMVFFTNRWLPPYRYLAHLMQDGYVGRVQDCTLEYLSGYGLADPYMWRLDSRRANGALGDIGPHMLDLLRWTLGEVRAVSASLAVYVQREDRSFQAANDAAMLLLDCAGGAQAFVHVSLATRLGEREAEQRFVAHGDAGTLEADLSDSAQIAIWGARTGRRERLDIPADWWSGVDPRRPFDVFERQSAGCRAFVDAILNDTPLAPNFDDGLAVQRIIDAALESASTGRAVAPV